METYIAYFDEAGDDGVSVSSSEAFILTSLYMKASDWQNNFDLIRDCRKELKELYGFHVTEELHTSHLLSDKNPYRNYNWTIEERQQIVIAMAKCIANLNAKIINVVIDKTKITDVNYQVLQNALKYNIQRIDNDSHGQWNYIVITDKGRLSPMRSTAQEIRAYNPIPSKYYDASFNKPIQSMIEDILEKDSSESYFIQVCDFVSYFVHMYFKTAFKNKPIPNRPSKVIDNNFIRRVMSTLKEGNVLNLKASARNSYGLVIYPK